MQKTYIHGISYYLPSDELDNEYLASIYEGWNAEKIYSKTGIQSRHIAKKDEFASDMAEKAVVKLFDEYNIDPKSIDFIMLCTQSPDYFLPTTACVLQHKLGLPTACGALDFNLGCSGFVYGLALAKSLAVSGIGSNILLITSETYSKFIHPMDKSVRTIFGDGAAAVLVKGYEGEEKIGQFVLGTDGSGAENLIVPAGAMRYPKTQDTEIEYQDESGNTRTKSNLYMNGPEIFNFTIDVVPNLVNDILQKNNISLEDIDLFVFHQANKYILNYLRTKTKIPKDKFYINLEYTGNTVSSSIPIALKSALAEGKIKDGGSIMVVGFGVGYSWGGTVIKI